MKTTVLVPILLLLPVSFDTPAAGPVGLEAIERFELISTLRQGVRAYQCSSHEPNGGNRDRGYYLEVIGNEQVLLDVKVPGCIYRIWFTGHDQNGRIRFYFDGSATPLVDMRLADFFSGTTAPFLAPLVGNNAVSSGGFYCYLPMAFREGCKITSTGGDHYYNITYHEFDDGEGITTFTGLEDSSVARAMWENAGNDPKPDQGDTTISDSTALPSGSTLEIANIQSPGIIQQLVIEIPGISFGQIPYQVTDDGRAFGTGGHCEFDVSIDPANHGIELKRRIDPAIGNQKGNVFVDDVLTGQWFTEGVSGGWKDVVFDIPHSFTNGKSSITVRVEFVSSNLDWNEFYYWISSLVGDEYVLSDEVDIGDSASEAAHNYTIVNQTWAGTRHFYYYPEMDPEVKALLAGLRLKIYWDGLPEAAVDTPLGDFFGCGLGPYPVDGLPVGINEDRLYCYFPMPFSSSAVAQIINSGGAAVEELVYTVRYTALQNPPEGVGYFHAKFLSEKPTPLGRDYVFLDETGAGHLVGVVQTIRGQTSSRYYLEGDERIYTDGSLSPALYGTGTEDFYNGGWYFNRGPFTLPVHGNPAHEPGGRNATGCYRFFLSDPIPFNTSILVGIEAGGSNDVTPDIQSVAFYYKAPQPLATLTDELGVGDATSEAAHGYIVTGQTWSGTTTDEYEGDHDGVSVTDDGRRFTTDGSSEFTVAIDPINDGVLLRRRMDYNIARQHGEVYIDGVLAGVWYEAGSNAYHTFRDSEFMVPSSLTQGKSSITVRIENLSASSDWTEYHYWVYTLLPATLFVDSDGDGLPDLWELLYFDNLSHGPNEDFELDGLTNLEEYEYDTDPTEANTDADEINDGEEVEQGSDPARFTYYVDDTNGDNSNDGLLPYSADGHGPKKTIQAGIDVAAQREEVAVLEGYYLGSGNKDLNLVGFAIIVKGLKGAEFTIIDCRDSGRGFYCHGIGGPGAVIDGFTIKNGSASPDGGAIDCESSNLTINNCVITDNLCTGNGGGVRCRANSEVKLTNCLLAGNSSGNLGGGISSGNSEITITNCTITENSSPNFGGGVMFSWGSSGTITDSILWGNAAPEGAQIALKATAKPSTASVSYSDLEGGKSAVYVMEGCTLNWSSGNITGNPLFTTGPLGDYYLSQAASGQASDSPCVDAGSATAANLGLDRHTTRTDGIPDEGTADMGYHAPYTLQIDTITRGGDDVTIHWNAIPGVGYIVQWSADMETWNDVPVGETDNRTDIGGALVSERYYRVMEN